METNCGQPEATGRCGGHCRVFGQPARTAPVSAAGASGSWPWIPGFRTGAKLVCLDEQGQLLHHETVFRWGRNVRPAQPRSGSGSWCRFAIQAVAVGNGTAGGKPKRLSAPWGFSGRRCGHGQRVRGLGLFRLGHRPGGVSGSGPDRARRRVHRPQADGPLAELVKIDPKAIGVGQYQHDVDQAALKRALDDTVISCVNAVGVELNTASPPCWPLCPGWDRPWPKHRGPAR
jgi:protein Tex